MRRLAAGFVVSVLVLACSLCSANTLSDQEIIERTFQTFVEGMQELDIAKVLSVLADPVILDGESRPKSELAQPLEPPYDNSSLWYGYNDLSFTIKGDRAEGSVRLIQDIVWCDGQSIGQDWEEMFVEMVFQKTGNAWLVSRMDVIGITNENYWSSSEEKEVKERAILRVLVFGLSMPGDLTRLVSADFFRFPISVYETDEAGTRATVLNKDAFYAYLEEFESSPIREYGLIDLEVTVLEGFKCLVKCVEQSLRELPDDDRLLSCQRELWFYLDELARITELRFFPPIESVMLQQEVEKR
ncbi:MAG: hypothetical protein QM451_03540 [Bacillota bacterium]|jgi:ketosteroid isomerase-like protein|nr:hypothetical protein [Bacillota bacterium]